MSHHFLTSGRCVLRRLMPALLLSACGASSSLSWSQTQTTAYLSLYGTAPKHAQLQAMPYANAAAPKGGSMSFRELGTFDNLNAMNGKGSFAAGTDNLFDSLMARSGDEAGVMYPLLAEKVTFDAKHPNQIIFHLNPKARFSDGSPVTAADVKFTFDTYQTKANYGVQMYISDLAKTEVLSKYQVRMRFKSAENTELPSILAELPIYSQADWQKRDFSRVSLQPILGSGPYVVDRIDAGRSLSYKRDPNYWGKDLLVNRGRYNVDRIKYVYYQDLNVAFEGFKSGAYSIQNELTAKTWATAYQFPAAKAGMIRQQSIHLENPSVTQSFVFNLRRAPMNDIHFRQALSYAYDFEWLNQAMFYGKYQRLHSYYQNSELEARGMPSADELKVLQPYLSKLDPLQRQGVLAQWSYPKSDGRGFNREGLLQARQILQDAGYRIVDGRLLDRSGQPIRLEFMLVQEGLQRTLMPFVRNAKKLGIEIDVRVVDAPQYMQRRRSYDYDMTSLAMPQSLSPGNEQAQMWGSRAANEEGNYNYSGIQNPAIDAQIQKIINAPNREQLVLHTRVLDRLLRAGYYQILTYSKPDTWIASWDLYQQPSKQAALTTALDYWWVDPKKTARIAAYLGRSKVFE